MDDFKKMPKMSGMSGCGCSVPRMKTGGYVSKAIAVEDQGFKPMKKASGGIISLLPEKLTGKPAFGSAAAPGKPSMAARREAMKVKPKAKPKAKLDVLIAVGKGKKHGGEVKESAKHEALEKKEVKAVKTELKAHEKKPASKAHKGLKYGGVAKGYANGGAVRSPETATADEFNRQFYALNPGAGRWNEKWGALGQQAYLQDLIRRNQGQYKMPGVMADPNVPVIPEYQGMGIRDGAFTGGGSPAVSSATPQSTAGLGMVNARLASRNMPLQQAPVDNGNGGFGPALPRDLGQIGPQAGSNSPIGFLTQGGGGYNKYTPNRATVQGNRLVQGPTGMKNGGRVK